MFSQDLSMAFDFWKPAIVNGFQHILSAWSVQNGRISEMDNSLILTGHTSWPPSSYNKYPFTVTIQIRYDGPLKFRVRDSGTIQTFPLTEDGFVQAVQYILNEGPYRFLTN